MSNNTNNAINDADLVDLPSLNHVVRRIAENIGIDNAILLLTKAGGQKRYVPATPTVNHALVQEFNLTIAVGLANIWPSQTVELPMPNRLLNQIRNKRIVMGKLAGKTNREFIETYGITRRRIEQIMLEQNKQCDDQEQQEEFNF
jgi:hypothetical protein